MLGEEQNSGAACRFERIVLTGFRATGKTAAGARLARRLGFGFIDTDAELCTGIGCTIAEYVGRHGWPAFRQKERELLATLAGAGRMVIATGGGAIMHEAEWNELRRNSLVVWLRADAGTIRQRLQEDGATAGQRPSLTGRDCVDEVELQLKARETLYSKGSDMSIDTAARTPDQIVTDIMNEISSGSQG